MQKSMAWLTADPFPRRHETQVSPRSTNLLNRVAGCRLTEFGRSKGQFLPRFWFGSNTRYTWQAREE